MYSHINRQVMLYPMNLITFFISEKLKVDDLSGFDCLYNG